GGRRLARLGQVPVAGGRPERGPGRRGRQRWSQRGLGVPARRGSARALDLPRRDRVDVPRVGRPDPGRDRPRVDPPMRLRALAALGALLLLSALAWAQSKSTQDAPEVLAPPPVSLTAL